MPHIKAIRRYITAGLSSAPVKIADKYPSMLSSWKKYQSEKPTENEIKQWQTSYRDSDIYGCCLFCGAISGNLEVLDIDNHLGNAEEIFNQLTSIDEVSNIVGNLPIETTKSGGYHIFYRCDKVDGNLKLAIQQKKTVIETRGEGGLIVCAPTKGYELQQLSLTEIPTITPEQKETLFEYARTFSDIEDVKPIIEQKEIQHKEYDGVRPGDWYNENGIEDSKALLRENGWTQLTTGSRELWRRPGKNKGVSATFGFVAPSIFYPFSANSAPFEERKCYSPFYIYALLKHNNDYSAAGREIMQRYGLKQSRTEPTRADYSLTEQNRADRATGTTATDHRQATSPHDFIKIKAQITKTDDRNFWFFSGKDGTKFNIDYKLLKVFLEKNGVFRYEINKDKYLFLQITDNIAESVSFETIRDLILNHLDRIDETEIYNRFCDSSKFNKNTISMVSSVEISWLKDTKEECFLFFKNGYTRTTAKETTLNDYATMHGVIWKSQQLNRDYHQNNEFDIKQSYPYKFCDKVSASDTTRINAYMSALGYLSHGFKQESFCPAIIFCDENDTDEAWGGTGKGMSAKFIGHVRNLVTLDGKSFDSKERFALQRVKEDTNIILIDDISKNSNFENLYSKISEGITINQLYLGEIYIPFKNAPKWVITSNYILKGANSSSNNRRQFNIEIHRYFTPEHTPDQEFDKSFFHEWNDDDWSGFDHFMHECIRLWLSNGLIKPNYVTVDRNKLKVNTSPEFVEWAMNNIKTDSKYLKYDLLIKFKKDLNNPYIDKHMSQNMFSRWITQYCEFMKLDANMNFGTGGQYIKIGNCEDGLAFEDSQEEEAPF